MGNIFVELLLVLGCKLIEKDEGLALFLNLIALRMAKTLLSFDRSECNRVKRDNPVIYSP